MAENLMPSMSGFWRNGGVGSGNYNASQAGITLEPEIWTVAVEPSTEYRLQAFVQGIDYGVLAGVHQVDADGKFLNDSGWKRLDQGGYTFTTMGNAAGIRLVVRSSDYTYAGRDVLRADMGERVFLRMSETPYDTWEPTPAEAGGGWLND